MEAGTAPDPMTLHPVAGQPRVVLLKPLITSPLIEVGELSYYYDPEFADEFETRNVLHHYGPDRLITGKFCALGAGNTLIMNGANDRMSGVSTLSIARVVRLGRRLPRRAGGLGSGARDHRRGVPHDLPRSSWWPS